MARLLRALLFLFGCTTAYAQNPVQEVQQAAPQLLAFSGSPLNFQGLVQGLAQGRPVMLTTTYPDGTAEVASFVPAAAMPVASIIVALEQARLQLSSVGVARPSATQLATALVGGTLARPNVQLGGLLATSPASPGLQTQLIAVSAPSASAGGSAPSGAPAIAQPAVPAAPAAPAPAPSFTPSPSSITMDSPATPGASLHIPPAIVPGARASQY